MTCGPRLAEYIENEPARKKAQQEAQRAKLEALERKLGIAPNGSSSSVPAEVAPAGAGAGTKRRLDDTEYVEQSREIVDSVKSAVSVGLLKKKKKAKTASGNPPASAPAMTQEEALAANEAAAVKATDVGQSGSTVAAVVETVLESPVTAPAIVAVAASAAAGLASA